MKHRGVVCDKCGVEVIQSKVRRERMGHIELAQLLWHISGFSGGTEQDRDMLDMTMRHLEEGALFRS